MKWVNKFFNNNTTIIIILIIILLLAFYFNSDFGLGMRKVIEPLENSTLIYYSYDGGYSTLSTDSSGNINMTIVDSNGNENVYTKSITNNNIYIGPNGRIAEILTDNYSKKTIVVTYPDGRKIVYYNQNINYYYENTNYDNYNHYSGEFENVTFYGPDGGTAQVVRTPDENTIVITYKNGITDIYYINNDDDDINTYTGPNGNTAKVITDINGKKIVEITFSDGRKIYYYNIYHPYTHPYANPYTHPYNYPYTHPYTHPYTRQYNHPYSDISSTKNTSPDGNTDTTYDGFSGNTDSVRNTETNVNSNNNLLDEGIRKSQIPPGEEDKYILKSQVVPLMCPKCPDVQSSSSFDESKCGPCPACPRCPSEGTFTCEKVPNYNAFNPKTMPLPVLSDFSNFGM